MKFNDDITPYLKGEKFSNALHIPFRYHQPIPKRVELLTNLSKSKKVIHLGCLDHLPLIDSKIARGEWLHKRITDVATKCIGIDINIEANEYVKTKHQINNIIIKDITAEPIPEIINEKWDCAILGELLEHTDNPVQYLSEIKEKYHEHISEIIITVPNAFTRQNFRIAKASSELINSDHRYWFTPYTLAKVMHQAGIEVVDIQFSNRIQLTPAELIKRKLLGFLGQEPSFGFDYANSIVAIGKL